MDQYGLAIRDVDPEERRAFKVTCMYQGHTIRSAIMWFISQVNSGKIKLPKLEANDGKERKA